jgi:hypothetical protein
MKMIFRMNNRMMNGMMKNPGNSPNCFQHFFLRALNMFPGCCMRVLTLSVPKSRMKSCFSGCSWMFRDMKNAVFLCYCLPWYCYKKVWYWFWDYYSWVYSSCSHYYTRAWKQVLYSW